MTNQELVTLLKTLKDFGVTHYQQDGLIIDMTATEAPAIEPLPIRAIDERMAATLDQLPPAYRDLLNRG